MLKFQATRNKTKFHSCREETDGIRSKLHDLKGKDRGMAHKDINKNYREIRELEQRITDEVLSSAEVLCTTNIGAGHFHNCKQKILDCSNR